MARLFKGGTHEALREELARRLTPEVRREASASRREQSVNNFAPSTGQQKVLSGANPVKNQREITPA